VVRTHASRRGVHVLGRPNDGHPLQSRRWSEPTRLVAVCTYWGGRTTVTHCSHGGTVTESLSPELAQRGALVEVTA